MEFHEVVNIFPLLTGNEFESLRDDIKTNGLLEPIVIHEGKILDGRNRYTACLGADVVPDYEDYDGDDPLGFVLSKNLHRRHLNESQRMLVGSKIANIPKHIHKSDTQIYVSQSDAADMMNVSERGIQMVKKVERDAPDLIPAIESGEMTVNKAIQTARKIKTDNERTAIAQSALDLEPDERWNVSVGDINSWQTDSKYDFIITDPPYPKDYLPLYAVLAQRAREWLKPDGLLIAMCGQSYLDQIYQMMSKHLDYYWTSAYLLPGQPTPLRHRQVNASWKPILIYSPGDNYKGKIFGDVYKSDGNDKSFHKWGQSVSGMYSLISQICLPGQSIFDPFCGAGTTGVAALKHGCLFDGIDLDEDNINISKVRLSEYDSET